MKILREEGLSTLRHAPGENYQKNTRKIQKFKNLTVFDYASWYLYISLSVKTYCSFNRNLYYYIIIYEYEVEIC